MNEAKYNKIIIKQMFIYFTLTEFIRSSQSLRSSHSISRHCTFNLELEFQVHFGLYRIQTYWSTVFAFINYFFCIFHYHKALANAIMRLWFVLCIVVVEPVPESNPGGLWICLEGERASNIEVQRVGSVVYWKPFQV